MNRDVLEPARPDAGISSKEFAPHVPWKWIVPCLIVAASFVLYYLLAEHRKAEALREQITTAHQEQLAPIANRYNQFRRRLESWVQQSVARAPTGVIDPKLDVSALHRGEGLYLRLPWKDGVKPATIEGAAKRMRGDALTRCLGVAPMSARGLYEKGEFLSPAWLKKAQQTSSVMRLRVIDDELARHVRRDLPALGQMLQADWFLLVVDQPQRTTADVFLWDLRTDRNLMSVRSAPAAGVVTARYGEKSASNVRPQDNAKVTAGAVFDCAVATEIKRRASPDAQPTDGTKSPDGLGAGAGSR
jgi:hypothetical protein